MNRICGECGIIYFHIRDDGVLICHNGHIIHRWNGMQMVPIVL
jgi:hypothetical protein